LSTEELAYYAAQPLWFVLVTDVAILAPFAAGVALLMRSATSVWLFAISLAAILFTSLYELAAGTSRMLLDQGAMILSCIIVVVAILQLVYAWRMKQRGVLR
jgi:hypothetical protein